MIHLPGLNFDHGEDIADAKRGGERDLCHGRHNAWLEQDERGG